MLNNVTVITNPDISEHFAGYYCRTYKDLNSEVWHLSTCVTCHVKISCKNLN